ncbi:hypothetical protein C8F04DRAFT_1255959 [Mycena alexandri]|uniref:HMG box domain-containing protein n=1 Tax=Mycena alexandri TaxID=1745969 RepID=A0AAD6X465_9AGAR|nr:hypothetical protein C8F04DRAFT_1255959 [Mycena alexandri]
MLYNHDDRDVLLFTNTTAAKGDEVDEDDEAANQQLTSQTLNADGSPKRPMNAFMIFARRRRPQVSAEHQSMRTGDISKILSQEWKAMSASDKQFYLTQAKQLKESFNAKYPDYVYRRRPNNTRKRRKNPDSASLGANTASSSGSPAGDDDTSSPDAEDPPPLPDAHLGAGHGGRYPTQYAGYAYGAGYGAGGSGMYGHAHGHGRPASYPYPPAHANNEAAYRAFDAPRLLSSTYYPPYDNNAASSSHNLPSHTGAGLRKAQSSPSMPWASTSHSNGGSPSLPHLNGHAHSLSASSSSHSAHSSPHALPSDAANTYFQPSSGGTAGSYAQAHTHSPPTRYSPYPSSNSNSNSHSHSHSSTGAGSPAPYPPPSSHTHSPHAYSTSLSGSGSPAPYGSGGGSPPAAHASLSGYPTGAGNSSGLGLYPSPGTTGANASPRALLNGSGSSGLPGLAGLVGGGLGGGGGGGGGALGLNGMGDGFYWRDKL